EYGDVAVLCRASFYPEFIAMLMGSPVGLRLGSIGVTANQADGRGLDAGDLNGDGRTDVVAGHFDGSIDVLIQDATGTFTALPRESVGSAINGLTIADINGDGREDVVVPVPSRAEIWVRLSGQTGSPASTTTEPTHEHPGGGAAVADLTGDGVRDLVLGHGPHAISVAAGNGDGTFGPPWAYMGQATMLGDVVTADVNHDGKLDVGAAQPTGAEIFIQGR
ncbi:MAG TPA: VCBS repeat-containing protein, partial [Actinomycetota bacterium]|nr:VCBS repeat-containing protein [Actinomycetota bacterium]